MNQRDQELPQELSGSAERGSISNKRKESREKKNKSETENETDVMSDLSELGGSVGGLWRLG